MDRKFKRESKQTGMTEERKKALEAMRELKNSGKSRLNQAIEVRNNKLNELLIIIFYRTEKLILK